MKVRNKYYLELQRGDACSTSLYEESCEPRAQDNTEMPTPESFREAIDTTHPTIEVDVHHQRVVHSVLEACSLIRQPPIFSQSTRKRNHAKQHTDAVNLFLDNYYDHLHDVYSCIQESLHDHGQTQTNPSYTRFIDAISGALRFQLISPEGHDEDENGNEIVVPVVADPGVRHAEISYL